MKTIKDKRKFGWNKIPKNRYSKKGVGYSKEYRKNVRRKLGEVKDLIIHRQPIDLNVYCFVINDALRELGYQIHIWWNCFIKLYVWGYMHEFGYRGVVTNVYDILDEKKE